MSDSPENYVLDANVFIQAKRRFYPFNICPGYWDALCWYRAAGRVCSVDKVRDELERGGDALWDWAKAVFDETGFQDTAAAMADYGAMVAWVQGQSQFFPAAKAEFMAVADGWRRPMQRRRDACW